MKIFPVLTLFVTCICSCSSGPTAEEKAVFNARAEEIEKDLSLLNQRVDRILEKVDAIKEKQGLDIDLLGCVVEVVCASVDLICADITFRKGIRAFDCGVLEEMEKSMKAAEELFDLIEKKIRQYDEF